MHLEALQASFLSETNVYLGYTRYFWWSSWNWHQDDPPPPPPPPRPHTHTLPNKQKQKYNFNTRNGFVALKLVGFEVLLQSPYHIGQYLGIPQIQDVFLAAILDLASR